jgi:hypothetical protein
MIIAEVLTKLGRIHHELEVEGFDCCSLNIAMVDLVDQHSIRSGHHDHTERPKPEDPEGEDRTFSLGLSGVSNLEKLYQSLRDADNPHPRGEELLRDAEKVAISVRQHDYGHPSADFGRVADLLNALGFERHGEAISTLDRVVIAISVKLARLTHTPTHRDSWLDIAGYVLTAGMVMDREWEERNK